MYRLCHGEKDMRINYNALLKPQNSKLLAKLYLKMNVCSADSPLQHVKPGKCKLLPSLPPCMNTKPAGLPYESQDNLTICINGYWESLLCHDADVQCKSCPDQSLSLK